MHNTILDKPKIEKKLLILSETLIELFPTSENTPNIHTQNAHSFDTFM